MRFLVDMPLSPELAVWLNQRGHDAVHAFEVGLDRAPDREILDYARSDQRVVVTADLDYPRLLALTKAEGPGLILFRGGNYSKRETVERLTRAIETIPHHEFASSVVVIEKARIRRRRLPVEPGP